MTDEFDRLLEGALAARAEGAPACGGVTDVRRRVRRRRQRTSALTVLPVLVGAGAAAAWVRSGGQPGAASGSTDVLSTTSILLGTTTTVNGAAGFRCDAAGMTAGDAEAWLYFQSCEQYWSVGSAPASTTPGAEPTTTLWSGPSTESVVFVNASTTNGVAKQLTGQHFGAGLPVSSPTKSATSFVMYAGPDDESLAAAIATELELPLQESIDDRFVPTDMQSSPTIVVVIGDDLGIPLSNGVVDEATTVPAATLDGTAMRCWAQSEVDGGEVGYRYFRTCEPPPAPTGTTTGDTTAEITGDTLRVPSSAGDCTSGQYVIVETDTSRQMVAQKFGITVDEMDTANTETPGYIAFYPGLVITIPCGAGW